MKTKFMRIFLTIAGIVLFDYLFWKEVPGVNTLVFSLFILIAGTLADKSFFSRKGSILVSAGLLLAAISVALYSSFLSVICYFGAFLIFMGFSLEPEIRSIFYAVPGAISNFIFSPPLFVHDVVNLLTGKKTDVKFFRYLKLIILPLFIIFIFVTIYRFANPLFNHIFAEFDVLINKLFGWLLKFFSPGHFIFLIFITVLVCGIIYNSNIRFFRNLESKSDDRLHRKRISLANRMFPLKRMTGLKDENRSGNFLFIVMNGVLLLVNITEAIWLVRQNQKPEAHILAANLHEGTWLLLFSIFLSIIVLLFFFRRNLNFYTGNKFLVKNALAWLFLNGLLAVNVAFHDWLYISQYGLTYKRIGVLFFLLLVFGGLISMWIKISKHKSLYYLFRINAWILYTLILFFSLVNWDWAIAKYNLEIMNPPSKDVPLLLDLPARAYPVIEKNMHAINELNYLENNPDSTIFISFQQKKKSFIKRQQQVDWQSYNLSDRLAYYQLIKSN